MANNSRYEVLTFRSLSISQEGKQKGKVPDRGSHSLRAAFMKKETKVAVTRAGRPGRSGEVPRSGGR